ncbi:MAG: Ig-like domain-containing protein, partial [Lachnospiraceae bacterium]|nr:Ig-like domain-containing protein [Lachnospiraceae bacterium]
ANASSVTVAKKNIELKSGKTANVDAKVVLTTTKKAQLYKGHAAEIRYVSSNTAVATVDAKGKITAKGKGKCTVYAVAVDGKRTTVNVKVE